MSHGRRSLRPETTLSLAARPTEESYIRELPACCLRSFDDAVAAEQERRRLSLECECGGNWRVTSSFDSQVLERFVVHAGPRAGGGDIPPAA